MCAALSERFGSAAPSIRILYGRSVKAENAREILNTPDVSGVLISGASLLAADFNAIVDAARGLTRAQNG
jgi:triosephosphate isomerase